MESDFIMAITHSPKDIKKMREACHLAAETLCMVSEHLRPGITTNEINTLVHEYTLEHSAIPAPLNYRGFPKSVCTSVNHVVCHGIPDDTVLNNGDIINVDVTSIYPEKDGFHGDTSATFYIGEVSDEAKHVVEVARHCLELGIEVVRPGAHIGDIGHVIQQYAEASGCSVVRDYTGHGIGRIFHTEPSIPHVGEPGTGPRIRRGMMFTIEPMINVGGWEVKHLSDGWTVETKDGSLSAQFEHTLVVTRNGCEVLTRRPSALKNSEDKPWSKLGRMTCWTPNSR
jgi:methionyl aminopeptidase